jgi:hypothetical protein
MGLPFCYHCHQRREMTRIGNIMRFECGNPACNELVHLISARSAQANLRRWMAENWSPPLHRIRRHQPVVAEHQNHDSSTWTHCPVCFITDDAAA